MKKLTLMILALAIPATVSAETGAKKTHALDKVPTTSISVGAGRAGLDADFGSGYYLYEDSKGGALLGYSMSASHRFDLAESHGLRIDLRTFGSDNFVIGERDFREQTRHNLDGTWIWKLVSPLTLEASAGIEFNRLRFSSMPTTTFGGVPYYGSDYLRLRPALAVGLYPSIFFLRVELASPVILSASAYDGISSDAEKLDWTLVDRGFAYDIAVEFGILAADVLELGLRFVGSSWTATYDQPGGPVVGVANSTSSATFTIGLRF